MPESDNTTPPIPYHDRNFIIDDSDNDLFVKMKSIVDSGFPDAVEPMLLEFYKLLWKKKKKIAYKEIGDSTIYIHFPRINPLVRLFGSILMRFTEKE